MSYQKNKIKGKGGLISAISIVLVILLVVGALGWLSGGFKDWSVKDWFKKAETDWAAYSKKTGCSVLLITATKTTGDSPADALDQIFYGNKSDTSTMKILVSGENEYEKTYTTSVSGNFNIPFTLPKIGNYVIELWISSGTGTYGFGVGDKDTTVIGGDSVKKSSVLTECFFGKNVTGIGEGAFRQCRNLKNIVLSDSVASIGNYAFYECNNLSSIAIPKGVENIGN